MSASPADRDPRGVLRLGRIRGVPILVAPSWLGVVVLLTAIYGPVVRRVDTGAGSVVAYLASFGFAVLFALCILAHECGHTVVSLALGKPVRRIVLFALGGMSEMDGEPERPRDELLISAAGPAVSVLLAAVAWLLSWPFGSGVATTLLVLLCWSNLLVAAFNLLPALPLDGGRIVRGALAGLGVSRTTSTLVAAWAGRVVAVGVAVSGLFVDRTVLGVAAGLVSLALAAYLWFGAGVALKTARLTARLPEVDVATLLRPGVFVPTDVSVAEALRRAWDRDVRGIVLVDGAERWTAIVDEVGIGLVPPERRAWTPVTEVARPLEDGLVLPDGLDAEALLARMQAMPAHEYLVVRDDGSPAGIISTRDFARRLTTPRALPGPQPS
jgi:Zn-dependent protease/CBS domain-containing protein